MIQVECQLECWDEPTVLFYSTIGEFVRSMDAGVGCATGERDGAETLAWLVGHAKERSRDGIVWQVWPADAETSKICCETFIVTGLKEAGWRITGQELAKS